MSITRKSLADTIDEYDAEIASLQESKRERFQAYRDQVTELSGKDAAKDELEAVKKAIRRRQAATKKGAEVVDAADALADEVFEEITASRAPRAMRVREGDKSEAAETSIIEGRSESASGAASDSAPLQIQESHPVVAPTGGPFLDGDTTSSAGTEGDEDRQPIPQVGGDTDYVDSGPDPCMGAEVAPSSWGDENETDEQFAAGVQIMRDRAEAAADQQAAPNPRAFIKQLRPHCLHPDACGGQGRHHCFTCSVKIKDDPAESEAA